MIKSINITKMYYYAIIQASKASRVARILTNIFEILNFLGFRSNFEKEHCDCLNEIKLKFTCHIYSFSPRNKKLYSNFNRMIVWGGVNFLWFEHNK